VLRRRRKRVGPDYFEAHLPLEPVLEDSSQNTDTYGLGQVSVHAGPEALLLAPGRHVRSHGDDDRLVGRIQFGSDQVGRFHSAHAGHADIHQHHVVERSAHGRNGIHAVVGDVSLITEVLQHQQYDVLTDRFVFDHEHSAVDRAVQAAGRSEGSDAHRDNPDPSGTHPDMSTLRMRLIPELQCVSGTDGGSSGSWCFAPIVGSGDRRCRTSRRTRLPSQTGNALEQLSDARATQWSGADPKSQRSVPRGGHDTPSGDVVGARAPARG
jgi:hypothetical protein